MPKYSRGPSELGRVKLRIVDLEIEGGDDTLAESVRNAVAGALARNGAREALKQVRPTGAAAAALTVGGDDDAEAVETLEHDDENASVATPVRRPSQPRKRRTMNVLNDINFSGATISINDFVAGLNLDSATRKFTAVAVWFKDSLGISSINVDHVFTAYKKVGWNDFPKDPIATFKDLATKRDYKWLNKSAERGEYSVNHVGEQKISEWRKA